MQNNKYADMPKNLIYVHPLKVLYKKMNWELVQVSTYDFIIT